MLNRLLLPLLELERAERAHAEPVREPVKSDALDGEALEEMGLEFRPNECCLLRSPGKLELRCLEPLERLFLRTILQARVDVECFARKLLGDWQRLVVREERSELLAQQRHLLAHAQLSFLSRRRARVCFCFLLGLLDRVGRGLGDVEPTQTRVCYGGQAGSGEDCVLLIGRAHLVHEEVTVGARGDDKGVVE